MLTFRAFKHIPLVVVSASLFVEHLLGLLPVLPLGSAQDFLLFFLLVVMSSVSQISHAFLYKINHRMFQKVRILFEVQDFNNATKAELQYRLIKLTYLFVLSISTAMTALGHEDLKFNLAGGTVAHVASLMAFSTTTILELVFFFLLFNRCQIFLDKSFLLFFLLKVF